jgi:AraC-like DNA-binding protein
VKNQLPMLLFSSILGIFLSLILLYFNARKNGSTIFLGIFFLLLSLYGFYQYVLLYSKSVFLIEILLVGFSIVFPVLYLIGPMLYWYIRSVLTDNSRLNPKDIWHLMPLIIYFLSSIPYNFVPLDDKIQAAVAVVKDVSYIQTYHATILDEIFSVSAIYLSRPILVLIYTLWSVGLFINYLVKKKVSEVLSKQHFMKKWLCLLLGFLLILEVTQIFLIIKAFEMHFSELYFALNIFRIFSAAGLLGLMISPFFFPFILYGLPRVPESTLILDKEEGNKNQKPVEERKTTNHFETHYLNSIDQKANFYLQEFQPYLQPDFNIAQLSAQIHIPIHHLYYYFREEKKQHFNDYINEWRINHAKNLIKKGLIKEHTLEAIGLISGFPNRNSFSATFRKVEGIPPKTYVSQIKK